MRLQKCNIVDAGRIEARMPGPKPSGRLEIASQLPAASKVLPMSSGPRIVLLMLERIRSTSSAGATPGPLDAWELRADCFEQFFVQDIRAGASLEDALGGSDVVSAWQTELAASGLTVRWSVCDCGKSSGSQVPETEGPVTADVLVVDVRHERELVPETLTALLSQFLPTPILDDTSLPDSANSCDQSLEASRPTIVLLTARRGTGPVPGEPFAAGCEESQVQVPLWILGRKAHGSRVQALAGSFDLLPTMTALAGIADSHVVANQHASPDGSASSHSGLTPRSLTALQVSPQWPDDRVLLQQGDGWTARRSNEFLLVLREPAQPAADDGETDRRLYRKPEDVWNVHDVLATFAVAAEELERAT
jgi:hypothetical protein